MDDQSYDQWSEMLDELRKERSNLITEKAKTDGASFSVKEFFDISIKGLDEVTKNWWKLEKASWKKKTPDNPDAMVEQVREELFSVIDFEVDAVDEDLGNVQPTTNWAPDAVEAERARLVKFGDELKKSYKIKVNSLASSTNPVKANINEPKKIKKAMGANTQKSSIAVFTMFIFGLLLGTAGAVNFWYKVKKERALHQDEVEKIRTVSRALEDTLAVLQETFSQLAYGKIRNIPAIQADIRPIRNRYKREKEQLEKSFLKKRENILKTVPAGDRMDRSLVKLEDEKVSQMDILKRKEATRLEPLLIELKTLQDMMGQ